MDIGRLTKVDATTWRIEPHGAIRVPAIIYADESLFRDIDDKVYEQAANVATLPGIIGASYAMPDALGYGFVRGCLRPRSRRRCLSWRRGLRYFLWRPDNADRASVYDVRHVQTGYTF